MLADSFTRVKGQWLRGLRAKGCVSRVALRVCYVKSGSGVTLKVNILNKAARVVLYSKELLAAVQRMNQHLDRCELTVPEVYC